MIEDEDGSKYISKVAPGKAADGKLEVGDWVAAINGEPIDGDTLEEAVSKVLASPKRLVLETEAATSNSSLARTSGSQNRISEASIPRYPADRDASVTNKVRISSFTAESDGTHQTMTIALSRNSPMTEFGFTVAEFDDGTKCVQFNASMPPRQPSLSEFAYVSGLSLIHI